MVPLRNMPPEMPKLEYFRDLLPSTKPIPTEEGRLVSDYLLKQAFNSVTSCGEAPYLRPITRGPLMISYPINITYLARILNNHPDFTHSVSYETTQSRTHTKRHGATSYPVIEVSSKTRAADLACAFFPLCHRQHFASDEYCHYDSRSGEK